MKKNAAVPYAIIAVLGILAIIIISLIGVGQRNDIQEAEQADEGAATEETDEADEGETTDDPEEIFESNCASCHGGDLSGGMGPDLTSVGADHSEDEIHDIIMNGKGDMPAGMATEDEADVLSDWLADKQ